MPRPKRTEEIWDDLGLPVGEPKTLGRAIDIAAGGPVVRTIMDVEPVTEAEPATITEPTKGTVRKALTDVGKQVAPHVAPYLGGFDPESAGEEYRFSENLLAKSIPALAELGLYGGVGSLMVGSAKTVGPALWRASEDILPIARRQLASEVGAVELPKYAGSVNLERLDIPKTQKEYILRVAQENEQLITQARRGKISLEETQATAEKMLSQDVGLEKLKWKKGKALNAEEITAVRMRLAQSTGEVSRLARKVARGDNSDEALGNLVEAITQQIETQKETSAVATEAGRALSAMRIKPETGDLRQEYLKRMIEAFGGRKITEEVAQRMAVAAEAGPLDVIKFIQNISKATYSDKIYEAWINALLSGPKTHIVNTSSNTLVYFTKFPEIALEAAIETPKALIGKQRSRLWGEVAHEVMGTWEGLKQGTRKGLFAFKNELESGGLSKIEAYTKTAGPAIRGTKGKILRLPTRALMAEDEFFKAINYESKIRGLAYREAAKQGLRGAARTDKIAELIANPTQKMLNKAEAEMLYRVFQKPYGEYGKILTNLRKIPGIRYIIPFMRTPVNIAKYGLERTPLNFIRLAHKAIKGVELDYSAEIARSAMGSLVGATVVMYANEGHITGGGSPVKGQRSTQYRLGWQPYSIKIGDNFYSYNRYEPLGMVLGSAADYAEISSVASKVELKDLSLRIGMSITQNLTSKTFLKGLVDAINAIDDPQRYGENWLQSFTGTVVPTGLAQIAQATDPTLRRSDDIFSNIKRRTPWTSKDVLARLDLWGRPITLGAGGMASLSPTRVSTYRPDKVDLEMLNLGMNTQLPSGRIAGVQLTPEQHYDYVRLSGQRAKMRLDRHVSGSGWDKRSDESKERTIKREISNARQWARKQLEKEYPNLKKKIREAERKKVLQPLWLR